MKDKKCKVCGETYSPRSSFQKVCSPICAINHTQLAKAKKVQQEFNQETKRRRAALKSKTDWANEAQITFNRFIRERDHNKPCVSCGRGRANDNLTGGYFHAGHYRTTAAAPNLRFNCWNVHKQCPNCNNHRSGSITEYRIELVKRIGEKRVLTLEHSNDIVPREIEYYQRVKRIFNKRANLYKKNRERREWTYEKN